MPLFLRKPNPNPWLQIFWVLGATPTPTLSWPFLRGGREQPHTEEKERKAIVLYLSEKKSNSKEEETLAEALQKRTVKRQANPCSPTLDS